MSSGTPPSMCTRSKCASAAAAASAPWKRSTIARASQRLRSRGPVPRGGSLHGQQREPRRHRLVREAQRLAVLLLGRLGRRRCGCPATWTSSRRRRCPAGSASSAPPAGAGRRRAGCRAPSSRLNVWSVPAELDVGFDRDRVVALQQRIQQSRGSRSARRPCSAWRSRRARGSARRSGCAPARKSSSIAMSSHSPLRRPRATRVVAQDVEGLLLEGLRRWRRSPRPTARAASTSARYGSPTRAV